MPVEAVTYINNLDPANPAQSDQVAEGDNHIRNIKLGLKNTFPSIAGATNVTHTELTDLGEKSFKPGDLKMQAHGSWDLSKWHEASGALANVATDAALYAAIGTTWNTGGETPGVTFRLPSFADRYPRGRSGSVSVGAAGYLAGMVLAHSHTASASSGSTSTASTSVSVGACGTLGMSGVTGINNQSLDHTHGYTAPGAVQSMLHGSSFSDTKVTNSGGSNTGGSSIGYGSHTHNVSVAGADHIHPASATTTVSTATSTSVTVNANVGAENRPNTTTVVFLIKR